MLLSRHKGQMLCVDGAELDGSAGTPDVGGVAEASAVGQRSDGRVLCDEHHGSRC